MTTVLDQEVYSAPEAARLLGLAPSTLKYWLQGGVRRDVTYAPIIRPEPTDSRFVTWAEFIEAGWLAAYRKNKVPMRELRRFIELLRDDMGVPYPLAHSQPLMSGRDLVFKAQEKAGLDPYWRLVDPQLVLTYPGQMFMDQVTWEGEVAAGWRPVEDPRSSVRVRPDVRFGRPSVGGVSTIAVFEYAEDASLEEVVDAFGLSKADVRWALAFENARRAA